MPDQPASDGILRRWIDLQPVEVDADFMAAIGGHTLVATILTRRGITSLAAARAFLDPDAYHPAPALDLPDMQAACERIERAIAYGERICVWGDFDVDGQTSTTLLVTALRGLGAQVTFHIPVRVRESHGVNREYLEPILQDGARLIVTCDSGISSHEALAYARSRGADVVLTDHHDLPERLPEACAIVNPKRLPAGHPLASLPGVGVAYKLAEALYQRAGRADETTAFLDLVALGIVADLAIQSGDTRYLLQRGLPVLRAARRTGLQILYELSNLQPNFLTEEHIGFLLAPRLNAIGRLDDANPVVEFLTTEDAGRARVLATHLEGLNARRRLLTTQVLRAAQDQIEKEPDLLRQPALVLAHPEWPPGVIGIVASELVERYNRPTILLASPPGQPARGSARSIEGVNITEAIASQKHLLLGYGGHPMAAGLSLDPAHLPAFRRGIASFVEKALGGTPPRPTLTIDGEVSLADLSLDLVENLERLAPFGSGNPPLVLCVPGLTVLSSSTIGRDGSHLQVMVKDAQDQTRRVLWWGGADWPLPEGIFDLACVVRASNYRGQRDVTVEWVDARPMSEPEIDLRRRLAVIDQRGLDHPLPVLRQLQAETGAVIWGEAEARERLAADNLPSADRSLLAPASALIIWSTPPGRADLLAALDAVQPQTVIIFGVDPAGDSPEAFLKRLAGLVKYAIEKNGGKVALARLAAATAHREAAVRFGLRWMESCGMLRITWQENGQALLEGQPGRPADASAAGAALAQLKVLLDETRAYRQYFRTAEKDRLL